MSKCSSLITPPHLIPSKLDRQLRDIFLFFYFLFINLSIVLSIIHSNSLLFYPSVRPFVRSFYVFVFKFNIVFANNYLSKVCTHLLIIYNYYNSKVLLLLTTNI